MEPARLTSAAERQSDSRAYSAIGRLLIIILLYILSGFPAIRYTKKPSPSDKRKEGYVLTEKGLDLIPVLVELANWSAQHDLPG
jgi:hypothetical protein